MMYSKQVLIFTFFSLLIFSSSAFSKQVTVLFEIDLNEFLANTNMSVDDVGIRGSTAPLSWGRSLRLTDEKGQGIYAANVTFEQSDTAQVEFKIVLQGGLIWEEGEARKISLAEDSSFKTQSVFFANRLPSPFQRYLGNWKFDQAGFSMVWDGKNVVTQKLAGQITECNPINTDRSILCIVTNKRDANWTLGHMLWAYNSETEEISWLSHFYPDRIGVGTGSIDGQGNMRVKVSFQGEPNDTYRIYNWRWLTPDSYEMISKQYSSDGKLTGNWYGGVFKRVVN